MTSIDNRESALENKYAKDEEFRFRVNAKAVELLAVWGGRQMGLKGDAVQRYTDDVAKAGIENGLKHAMHKVRHDLGERGIAVTEHHIENQLQKHLAEARTALEGA
jgi:hypothetical protein